MRTVEATETATAQPGIHSRVVSILALAAVIATLGYGARGIYFALSDSWMAPINLSPDNDAVMQVNIRLNEQLADRSRLVSDVERIDVDVEGVGTAIARLDALKHDGDESLRWTAHVTSEQANFAKAKARSLHTQQSLLQEMLGRENDVLARTQRNVEAGLLSRQEHDREIQVLAQLRVTFGETQRELDEANAQGGEYGRAFEAIRAGIGGTGGKSADGMLPELLDREERRARVEVEKIKLESERRSLLSQKKIAVESVAKMDIILEQISHRPIYRAVKASTDVAFVPYSQLKGVTAGVDIVACTWAIFGCHTVGQVSEVLPGEVVAQDPWAEVARGQYAILDLTDREASKEKVLRTRRRSAH